MYFMFKHILFIILWEAFMYIMQINICKGEDLIPHKYYISSEKTLVGC
jgi:hypothetical protein